MNHKKTVTHPKFHRGSGSETGRAQKSQFPLPCFRFSVGCFPRAETEQKLNRKLLGVNPNFADDDRFQ